MANSAQGNHRHPKKANTKAKKLVKHRKVAKGGTALRGDLVTHFMGGVSFHQVKPRVAKKVAKSQDDELMDAQIDAATARGEERA
jgi:hypothetical protein